ncbi:phosphoribosylaminoimidazolesuccinocarboxamide synthase [Candidatus Pacearchaeota archaeon]|nr:phosphoribosylaminoimidazolesuccinocarboxamide synthase [Candidatus Pacearchaeota archaeon]
MNLEKTNLDIGKKHEGKVRDSYFLEDKIIMITTDRISAFDVVLGTIPCKGQILNQLSAFWFGETEHIIQNHLIEVPDPNTLVVKRCNPIPLEIIVRGHIRRPDNSWKEIETPIVTPTTKAAKGFHDQPITKEEIIGTGVLTEKEYEEIKYKALELFNFGKNLTLSKGEEFTLLDTKYEFARGADGKLVLIDEIHTPDSSRTKGQYDKEFLRTWLKERGYSGNGAIPEIPEDVKSELFSRYARFYEAVIGTKFVPEKDNSEKRIKRNLRNAGYLR